MNDPHDETDDGNQHAQGGTDIAPAEAGRKQDDTGNRE